MLYRLIILGTLVLAGSGVLAADCPDLTAREVTYTLEEELGLTIRGPEGFKVTSSGSDHASSGQLRKDPTKMRHPDFEQIPSRFFSYTLYRRPMNREQMEEKAEGRLKKDDYASAGIVTLAGEKVPLLRKTYRSGNTALHTFYKLQGQFYHLILKPNGPESCTRATTDMMLELFAD